MIARVLALAATLLATAAQAECRLGRIAQLPLQISHGHLLVQGKVDNQPATFIFDTGSQTTLLTEAAVGLLALHAVRGEEHGIGALGTVEGVGGNNSARAVEARSIDLGGLRARNFAFLASPIDLSFIQPTPDGLLSADLLAKYDIDLDLQGQAIRLYYPMSDCSQPAAYLHGPLYQAPLLAGSRDRSPRVTVTIGDHDFTAVLDTGAPHTTLFRDAARALGFAPAGPGQAAHIVHGIGRGTVAMAIYRLPSLAVGDLEFGNMPVEVADQTMGTGFSHTDMLLGMDFLSRVHAWISFSSNTLILQYPPTPSPAD